MEEIKDIVEALSPKSVTELRSFLWLDGYFRRPISNFTESSEVLHADMSVKKTFEWTPEMQNAFEHMRERPISSSACISVLLLSDRDKDWRFITCPRIVTLEEE